MEWWWDRKKLCAYRKQKLDCLFFTNGHQMRQTSQALIMLRRASLQWRMVEAVSCCGEIFHQQELWNWSEFKERQMEPNTEKPLKGPVGPHPEIWDLLHKFNFQKGNGPKHCRFKENQVNDMGWASQSSDRSSTEELVWFKDCWTLTTAIQPKGRMERFYKPRSWRQTWKDLMLELLYSIYVLGRLKTCTHRLSLFFWK